MQSKARGPFSQAARRCRRPAVEGRFISAGGRGLANVSARIVPLENGRVDVVFDIVEGDKTGVKAIDFVWQ